MFGSPGTHPVQYRAQAMALAGESVLYSRRNLGIDSTFQNAGILEFLQPLSQGSRTHAGERATQLSETLRARQKVTQYE